MEANTDIARGFYKGSKENLLRFWKKVETELNSMGPPSKCSAEWKKVWADQKKYVRQKAAQNLRHQKGTGGGPNKEAKFSSMDEAIYNLVGMKTSMEGVSTKSYGLNSPTNKENIIQALADEVFSENVLSQELDEPKELVENTAEINGITASHTPPSTSPKFPTFQKLPLNKELEKNSYDALQAELEIQRDLVKTIKVIVENQKEQQQNTKRIYRSLEKLNENFKKIENLKREELLELRRHNAFMEKQRVKEIEYKLEKNSLEMQLREYKK